MNYMDLPEQRQARDRLREIEQESDEAPTLIDRWEQLGREHQLVVEETTSTATRKTWIWFNARCSCGDKIFNVAYVEAQVCAHTEAMVEARRQEGHLKHLVTLLLDEDWVPAEGYIPIEMA